MNKEEFVLLPMQEKVELVWQQGEIISEKAYYDCNITLFLLEDFFVEIFFSRTSEEIVGTEIQDHPQILFEYVKDLDLSELQRLLEGRDK